MSRPNSKTEFKPISELANYSDPEKWFCAGVVFSPETENEHFHGCPPYIEINDVRLGGISIYFEVPEIVAYYAKTHAGYTHAGIKRYKEQGAAEIKREIARLLKV